MTTLDVFNLPVLSITRSTESYEPMFVHKNKMNKDTVKQTVLKDYPEANCKLRPTGKKYYQIHSNTTPSSIVLGQGKSKDAAWKAAYNNL